MTILTRGRKHNNAGPTRERQIQGVEGGRLLGSWVVERPIRCYTTKPSAVGQSWFVVPRVRALLLARDSYLVPWSLNADILQQYLRVLLCCCPFLASHQLFGDKVRAIRFGCFSRLQKGYHKKSHRSSTRFTLFNERSFVLFHKRRTTTSRRRVESTDCYDTITQQYQVRTTYTTYVLLCLRFQATATETCNQPTDD